jgi:hypothetical protein
MSARPEPSEWLDDSERTCPDCGGPIEANTATEKPYLICRPCYDAYVDNAGR